MPATRTLAGSALPKDVSTAEVRTVLERVLTSRVFRGAERLSCFLRYSVEQVLAGRADDLKEYNVGLAVFGRAPDFDPRIDPIVRVEAGRLRLRLKRYYETEGAGSWPRIDLPKGGYVPRILTKPDTTRPEPMDDHSADDGPKQIGVLIAPFTNLEPEHDHAYLCHGLREEIINALTKIPVLQVFALGATSVDPRETAIFSLGEKLGVDYVLTGSIRSRRSRIRVIAQLVRRPVQDYVWSETFEREAGDVFALQEEIARAIAAALEVKLAAPGPSPQPRHTGDYRAYKLYLKGRYFWNLRTEPALWKGVDFFQQSVSTDNRYALAYTGLADSYTLLANYGWVAPREARQQAKAAALRAVAVGPGLAEAHNSLAHVLATYEWDWEAAEREFETAIALNPGYATSHHWYAITLLGPLGRLDEALFEIERARSLDPVSLSINRDLAVIHVFRRRYDLALEQCKRTIAVDPHFPGGFWVQGLAYQQIGAHEKAVESFQHALELASDYPRLLGALGHGYALNGREAEARRILSRLEELGRHRYVNPFESALIYVGLGEFETAFHFLDRAYALRSYELVALQVDPRFDPLRLHPQYQRLVDLMGLRGFAEQPKHPGRGRRPLSSEPATASRVMQSADQP